MLLINLLVLIISVLLGVAFLTLFERKVLGYVHNRKGPNKLFVKGFTQPFSDALKLLSKEVLIFYMKDYIYFFSSMFMFLFSMMLWLVYPWLMNNFSYSILVMILFLSFNVYPVIFIAWSSNNNYSMLSSLRVVAQMISFEIMLFILIFVFILLIESFSLNLLFKFQDLVFAVVLLPIYLIVFISMLIELNRTPFDLIEGESELVSGFNIEFSGGLFTLIFLAEYSSIMFMGVFLTILFYGVMPQSFIFVLIYMIHVYLIILVRGVLPRIRYDQMMYMCWTDFLIISLTYMFYIWVIKEGLLLMS
uniref:NADH dehydrogenase subunit 1 n=1 Tax=Melecta chinensis TaxID=582934 RepID=UPI002551D9B9|nr:NADH dehydrogenase subunit 1 [Melecta chinensis]WFP44662.1 NADH dehydrogenase subunit 1 [Melecta chinensis]